MSDLLRRIVDDPKETLVTHPAPEVQDFGSTVGDWVKRLDPLAPSPSPAPNTAPTPPPSPTPASAHGPTLDQQMQAYQATKHDSQLGDMAMTGIAAGLTGGVLANLVSSWKDRRKPKGDYKSLYPDARTAVPFAPKLAGITEGNPIADGMTTDPMHGLKLVGALGLPALGTFLATKGVGSFMRKQKRKDDADAVQGEYQRALNDYATTASGLKLAGEKTALDRLAEVKTASPHLLNGFGLAGQGNPIVDTAVTALNVGGLGALLYGGWRLHQGLKKQKAVADDAKGVHDRAISDWRRKELFYRPPPITAVPTSVPEQG